MLPENPYAPPSAHVDDVVAGNAGTQPVRTWSGTGRIGRLRYLAHLVVAYILVFVVSFVGGFVGGVGVPFVAEITAGVAVVAYLVFMLLKSIQRSHDMDWSGWSGILALIPLVGLVWLFVPGTRGANRFGAPPPANTRGVVILALVFPALAIIGIIAAVSIPAYQEYTKRVQATQR